MRQFRPARMSVLKSSGTCFLHKVALLHPLVSSTTRLSFQARPFLFPSSSSLSSSFAENKLNYVGMNMSKSMSTNAHKHDEGSPPGHSINNGDIRGTESGLNKNNKTSIMFTLPDSPGALQTALGTCSYSLLLFKISISIATTTFLDRCTVSHMYKHMT